MTLEEAFNRYYTELVFLGRKMLQDRQAAQDVVADVFVNIKRCDIKDLKSYLYRAVKNGCINHQNKTKVRREDDLEEDMHVAEYVQMEIICLQKMYEAISTLPHAEKEVIELLLQDNETEQVANILGKPTATIRSLKRHAIDKLRKAIL